MELRKLLDKIWELVNSGELDGSDIPELDLCENELQALVNAYTEKHLIKEMNWQYRKNE